ncbi:expressed unknown protein [Seminavis robusta]|uniref:DUF4209 domain-containing protein n=1 Tax=Seminavis robusta TaxID=568900 RepID=A0A9N8HSP1_9STRA|nr:expressed unknown protein [Seminavis robusta]|eukprot:Sro1469_g275360.1 n/a (750) ;mRNA; r:25814-28063
MVTPPHHDERPEIRFPFVDPSIAAILACRPSNGITTGTPSFGYYLKRNAGTLQLQGWKDNAHVSQEQRLIHLALECDDCVFVQQALFSTKTCTTVDPHDSTGTNSSQDPKAPDQQCLETLVEWGSNNNNNTVASSTAKRVMATLLALNRLEAAIRRATGHHTAGRAPLLKDMLQTLQETTTTTSSSQSTEISSVLQVLLLPTGLNLRNLLWHGFVADLPRPWLALVVVLIVLLEQDTPKSVSPSLDKDHDDQELLPNLRAYSSYGPILKRGQELLQGPDLIKSTSASWMSSSHQYQQWWTLIQQWAQEYHGHTQQHPNTTTGYPLCSCILLTCLLEHMLRQLWCQDNNQQAQDSKARPAKYYVTLDGHGQRHQHNVLLHPFLVKDDGSTQVRNALVQRLGAPTMTLLADLYCSPCGGPNLRASLAHGSWDTWLQQELLLRHSSTAITTTDTTSIAINRNNNEWCWDLVLVLLVLMEAVTITQTDPVKRNALLLQHYRPLFSFTTVTCLKMERALEQLARLETMVHSSHYRDQFTAAATTSNTLLASCQNILELQVGESQLAQLAQPVYTQCRYSTTTTTTTPWTVDDLFHEHETNQRLASLGAARALLEDVQEATCAFCDGMEQILQPQPGSLSTRQRKQRLRILAIHPLASSVYSFAAMTAILLIDYELQSSATDKTQHAKQSTIVVDRETLLQAVKRSRMVVSTVSNFITANADRAIKAAKEYRQGKAVKAVLASTVQPVSGGGSTA